MIITKEGLLTLDLHFLFLDHHLAISLSFSSFRTGLHHTHKNNMEKSRLSWIYLAKTQVWFIGKNGPSSPFPFILATPNL